MLYLMQLLADLYIDEESGEMTDDELEKMAHDIASRFTDFMKGLLAEFPQVIDDTPL